MDEDGDLLVTEPVETVFVGTSEEIFASLTQLIEEHGVGEYRVSGSWGLLCYLVQLLQQQRDDFEPHTMRVWPFPFTLSFPIGFVEEQQEGQEGVPGMDPVDIDALTTRVVTEGEVLEAGDCPVCLGTYTVGEEIMELPCQHSAHSQCLERWLRIRGSCPLCRSQPMG